MKTNVFYSSGVKSGEIELADDIFGIVPNEAVIHESIVAYLANQRRGTKSALTRAEVSGGGAKPWRQKGTGHARQGSTRAPQWRHGGIVFAPKPRDYSVSLNKKVKNLAIRSVLSQKAQSGNLIVLEDFSMDSYKTKCLIDLMKALDITKSSLILPESNKYIVKSANNIKDIAVLHAESLNSYDIFYHEKLVILKNAISKICEIFSPKCSKINKVVA